MRALTTEIFLALGMFAAAALYTSVGHGGASAYIALMALFAVPAASMRPTALVLNVLVASLASTRYIRAGLFRWRTLWPFLLGAIPMAFIGGRLQLPSNFYRPLLGLVLLLAAVRFLAPQDSGGKNDWSDPPVVPAIGIGALIGLLSGLTGTGGGIFLSPVLIFLAWSDTRAASGVAAVFILASSSAGLLGNLTTVHALPAELPLYAAAVLGGALIGTTLGIHTLATNGLLKALGTVVGIAGLKLLGVY
ncbi:MAG: sulfite exporter TauE/SafE family protein [Bosea sp. (in: a-proteobacteria)]